MPQERRSNRCPLELFPFPKRWLGGARLGGDKFAIIPSGADKPQAIRPVGEMVVEAVREPMELIGQTISVGATLVGAIAPFDARDALELVEKASSVLCHANRVRKGTIHFFIDVSDL